MSDIEIDELRIIEQQRRCADLNALTLDLTVEGADEFLLRYCSSAERPRIVLTLAPMLIAEVADFRVWTWIVNHWSGFDLIPHAAYSRLFRDCRHGWTSSCMSEADRKAYGALPDNVPLFRGQDASQPIGLSWTLDKEVAKGFAIGHRGLRNGQPVVYEKSFSKRDIAFLTFERSEMEVVVFSPPRRSSCKIM